MSHLTIYNDEESDMAVHDTADAAEIAQLLSEVGVRFERWETRSALPANADDDAVIEAYADDIARLKARGGYRSVDVVRLLPDNPAAAELRVKFLAEHVHADDEVRFFVEGSGLFYLHSDKRVLALLCEAGDLISVPAGMRHWFDMGPKPMFAAIRLFISPAGWVADFTGDPIASFFPKYEVVSAWSKSAA